MSGKISRARGNGIKNQIIEYGGLVFLRGLVALWKTDSVADQTRQILARIDECLAAAGTSKTRILQATVYLSDMSRKEEMNEVWAEWMPPEHEPARVTVGVTLSSPETLVEILVTAAQGER